MLVLDFHSRDDFADQDRLEKLSDSLRGRGHEVLAVEQDPEHGLHELRAVALDMGHREYFLSDEVVMTGEFRQLRLLYPHLKDLSGGKIQVMAGQAVTELTTRRALLDHLLETGRKG